MIGSFPQNMDGKGVCNDHNATRRLFDQFKRRLSDKRRNCFFVCNTGGTVKIKILGWNNKICYPLPFHFFTARANAHQAGGLGSAGLLSF